MNTQKVAIIVPKDLIMIIDKNSGEGKYQGKIGAISQKRLAAVYEGMKLVMDFTN
jgi:hypothetical protein